MVINSQDQITEAGAYQAYGAMVPLDSIANAPEIPAREKFTGKEFDQEGEDSANGVVGIQCYHFGARVYDPDVGVWLSVDPKEQLFYRYGYSTSPVNTVDPDGQFIWSLINTAAQWYVGNAITQGSLNPGKWNWDDPMLLAGTMITAMGMIGAIETGIKGYLAKTRGAQYTAEQNINVEESNVGHPSDNTPLSKRIRANFENYVSENSADIGNKEVTQYAYKENGKLKFDHVIGTEENTARLPWDCSKYIAIDHTHTVSGAIPTGYQQKGNFMLLNGDKSMLSTAQSRGFKSDIMRVYNVPDKKWFGFMHHPSPNKATMLMYWKIQ